MPPNASSLRGSAVWFPSPAHAEGPCVLRKHLACFSHSSPGPLRPAESADLGSWMLSLLLGDCCSPLILVSRPGAEVWFCPFLYCISLKKLFSPIRITPALDITVLPQGTISGCSLEAVPRSHLALANSRSPLPLFSQRRSHGSNALGLLWTDPSSAHQQMERVIHVALAAPGKAVHPLLLLVGMVQVQLLCVHLANPR